MGRLTEGFAYLNAYPDNRSHTNNLSYAKWIMCKLNKKDEKLKKSFEALTLGRRRAYNFYFSSSKKSKTRIARIEKYIPKILEGKGLNDWK